jgi:hypothetical protein
VYGRYIAELISEDRPIDNIRFASGYQWLIVSNDPDKTFNEAADHILHQANNLTAWQEDFLIGLYGDICQILISKPLC